MVWAYGEVPEGEVVVPFGQEVLVEDDLLSFGYPSVCIPTYGGGRSLLGDGDADVAVAVGVAVAEKGAATAVGGDAHGGVPEGEQVILDENLLAEGHDYFALGNLSVSPDHAWLVYSTDTTGGERYTMRFCELSTGLESPESLEDTSYGVAWANDNATVFFVRVDEAMRPYQLWRHRVGTDPSNDVLVLEEPDDRFYLGVGRTKDDRFILCGLDSKVTS